MAESRKSEGEEKPGTAPASEVPLIAEQIWPSQSKVRHTGPEQRFSAYNQVVNRAVDVFGSELKATHWLSRNNPDFGGQSPLEALAASGFDPSFILETLGKIEHGVYF